MTSCHFVAQGHMRWDLKMFSAQDAILPEA